MSGTAPLIAFAGYKHTGKTTLIARLLTELSARGLRVGCIKHDGHDFTLPHADADTGKYWHAGAVATVIASDTGHALAEWRGVSPNLEDLAARLGLVDLIIVEGFKHLAVPKWVLLGPLDGAAEYERPDFARLPEIAGFVQGFIVPALPLKVADTDLPVYHRDNILGILSAIDSMMRSVHDD